MRLAHRPTVLRVVALSAGLSLVAFTLAALLAPTLVDLFGAPTARNITLAIGVLARLIAGRLALRRTWRAGGDLRLVLGCVVVGGLLGWLLFPGLLSVVALLVTADFGGAWAGLAADVGWWLLALAVGGVAARWI